MKSSTAVVLTVTLTCSFVGEPLCAQTNALTRTSGARLHDDVGRDADRSLPCRHGWRRHRQLSDLLRPESDRKWILGYFVASDYDDPAVHAKSSPIIFIKQARTPTLVLVGDGDGECPRRQSFEFWHALKDLGVETQMVVYANEGHAFV